MVKIVNGMITNELKNNEINENNNNSSLLSSNITLFNYTVPIWTLSLPIITSIVIGGISGSMIVIGVIGIGYCLSDSQGGSNSSQVSLISNLLRIISTLLSFQSLP